MNGAGIIKVLLLEDDIDDYRRIARKLRNQRHHFAIDWAKTLATAIDQLERHPYDIVLADLAVSDSAGLQTVFQLRKLCGQTPIIAITSQDDEDVEKEILGVGAQDYLVKGELCGRTIVRAILHAVQRQQAMNEVHTLVLELERSQQLLQDQALLLREKNSRLRQLYKTAQEFVDNVSHDFRTPMTVIKDYVAIIREGLVGSVNDEQRIMLDKVSVRVDDLNNMVDDLLDVSKLESGLLGAWRRNVRMEDIITRAESLLQQRAHVKNVELVVECDSEMPEVYCDADKVGRVITNLAVNAIKFAGVRGKVRLWAESDPAGQQVIVGVKDNGPGIERNSLEKIFRRFQQLDNHLQSTVKGFGLGLNIAQQLCTLNLGELSVQSQLGKGSTFSFTIPFAYPIEILRRWLSVHGRIVSGLHVVEINVGEDVSPPTADEFDSFLNCLLRQEDLLFRITSRTWLLVVVISSSKSRKWFRRAKKEFERTNRNRPLGQLPEYHAKVRCEWSSRDTQHSILQRFEEVIRKVDDTCPVVCKVPNVKREPRITRINTDI